MTEPTIGDLLNQYFDQGRTGKHDETAQRIRLAIAGELQKIRAEADDETYEIGKRDGYSEAVQQIDQLTGGDGEYRYCLGDESSVRHTPDPATMVQRIADRFEVLNLLDQATKDGSDQPDDGPEFRPPIGDQEWCQPGDIRKRQFLVTFDDPECRNAVFDDEIEARRFWAKACLNWNCYLFGALPVDPTPVPRVRGIEQDKETS